MLRIYEFNQDEEQVLTAVYRQFLDEYKIKDSDIDVDITMLTIDEMHQLNKDSRNVDRPTDVLSFPFCEITLPFNKKNYPMDIDPESGAVCLGEIMICRDIMIEQSVEYNHSSVRECAYLTIHGLHHLLGFDHESDEDKARMRAGEEKILNKLNYIRA